MDFNNNKGKVTKENFSKVMKELFLFRRPLSDEYEKSKKSFKSYDKKLIERIDKNFKTKASITEFSKKNANIMSNISGGIRDREKAKVKAIRHEENLIRTIMYTVVGAVIVGLASIFISISPVNVSLALYGVLIYTGYNILGSIYQNLKVNKLDREISYNSKKLEKAFKETEEKDKEKEKKKEKEEQQTKVNQQTVSYNRPLDKVKKLVKKL